MDDLDAVAERLDAALSLARADSLRTAEFYGLLRMLRRKVRRLVTCTNLWWAWSGWNRRPADLVYLIHHPHGTRPGAIPEDTTRIASL
jgi:hypothetical protein